MSWEEAGLAAGAGALTGGASELAGLSGGKHFDSTLEQARLFHWRSARGAANFARNSLEASVITARGPALAESFRTAFWEFNNNLLTVDYFE
jgi:hypothetical protein